MNAPVPVSLAKIDVYQDLLESTFIDETITRQKTIVANRHASLQAIAAIKENCKTMRNDFQKLGDSMNSGARSFGQLAAACKRNAAAFHQITTSLQQLSRTMQQQAEMLRRHNSR